MKYLLHRSLALLLAVLLLVSVIPEMALAAPVVPSPRLELGTFSGDMLAGGGRQVLTEKGLFYIGDEDGYIYNMSRGREPVYAGEAQRLNYRDGSLYFARPEGNRFDLVRYELSTGRETVLLDNFAGTVGQFYLVGEDTLCFLSGSAVWSMKIGDKLPRMLLYDRELWSFVPTGLGLIYAKGSVFDYDLYAGDRLIVEHADNYYVDFDLRGGILIYSVEGRSYELSLAGCFDGLSEPETFRGGAASYGVVNTGFLSSGDADEVSAGEYAAALAMEAEIAGILEQEENQPPVPTEEPAEDPAEEPSEEPAENPAEEPSEEPVEEPVEQPAEEPAEEPVEEPVEEPAEEPVNNPSEEPVEEPSEQPAEEPSEEPAEEPSEGPAEDPTHYEEPTVVGPEYVPTEKDLGLLTGLPVEILQLPSPDEEPEGETPLRRPVTVGMENIIKRARQMLNIEWTPLKNVQCWKYWENGFTYKAGVTYKGLPYGQPVSGSYVPWNTSLTNFIAQVGNPDSRFYTATAGYNGTVGPYYAVDCSAFVSWAWNLPNRCSTSSILPYGTLISGASVSDIQLGDMLCRSDHVVMVTDVTYDDQGTITGVEISESTPVASYNCCCRSIWYRGTSGLATLRSKYLGSGYKLYRRNESLPEATYTHECVVPLPGDECPTCGEGMFLKPGVDVAQWHGEIEWSRASRYIDFAIIRLGGSTVTDGVLTPTLDSRFLENVQGCVAAVSEDRPTGLPYGLYYDSKASTPEEAHQEAEFVVSTLFELYQQGIIFPTLPVFIRVDDASTILAQSDSDLLASVTAFCQSMEDVGLLSGIYAATAVWNSRLTADDYDSWYHWVVQWGASCTAAPGAHLWQFSTLGSVPGVEGTLNLNYWFNGVGRRDHRYKTVTTTATCTEEGNLGYVCVECGQTVNRILPALGHDWGDPVTTTPPTCLDEGVETCTCTRCSATAATAVPALGHEFDEDDNCVRCGYHRTVWERFDDVNEGEWFVPGVQYCVDHKLFSGTSATTFSPRTACNRAMLVVVLYSLAGRPEVNGEHGFTDVQPTDYFNDAVIWAKQEGLVSGVTETTFAPRNKLTREQAALILMRFAEKAGKDVTASADLSGFPDVGDVSGWSRDAVSWAVASGFISGTARDGQILLDPKGKANRAQIATILMRFSEWINEEETP